MRRAFQFGFLGLAFCWPLLLSGAVLAWDANPDPSVVGYKLYQGATSYTNVIDTGTNRTIRMAITAPSVFSVTAYNAAGLESDFSAELAVNPRVYSLILESSVDLTAWSITQTLTLTNYSPKQFWRLRIE